MGFAMSPRHLILSVSLAFIGATASTAPLTNGIFASAYTKIDRSNWTSAEAGSAGRYTDNSVVTQDWWSDVSASTDATPNFYFGYGTNVQAKPWGFGAYVKAPANGTATVDGYADLKISVWGNPELTKTKPTLTVLMLGQMINGCASAVQSTISVLATDVQTYTVPLSSFTVKTACSFTNAIQILSAGVNEIHVQVLGSNVQYLNGGDANGNYPNGLNIGPIYFTGVAGAVSAQPLPQAVATGWNLLGNSYSGAMDVNAIFGDWNKVSTVWKWLPGPSQWAFYAPSMTAQQNADYCTSKGYALLTLILPKEGYWVNAITPFSLPAPASAVAATFSAAGDFFGNPNWQSGFNLLAIGKPVTPTQFNNTMAQTPDTIYGPMAANFVSLWTWDTARSLWSFYAPSLQASGGMTAVKDYASGKGYLDFSDPSKRIEVGSGFWVNRPAVAPAPSASSGCLNNATLSCISFDEANMALGPFNELSTSFVSDPLNTSNKVLKLTKTPSGSTWAGVTLDLSGSGAGTVPVMTFVDNKLMTLRVWSPAVAEPFMLKIESSIDSTVGIEALAHTQSANVWETLVFDFNKGSQRYDSTKRYDRISVFPHFGSQVSSNTTYLVDEFKTRLVSAANGDGLRRRAMPAAYSATKAINYGWTRAYAITDADILQDLGLLNAAGFGLIRLYGSDGTAQRVLTLAGQAYPLMKFQLGMGLQTAPSTCINSVNSDEIARGVALANQFANVVAVSVGNEPANLPVNCLAIYLSTVRSQVAQPITTNDVAAVYMGSTDAHWAQLILPLLDFASIHIYPFWELVWDWQQAGVAAGPARAQAMMAASVTYLKDYYQQVQQFAYQNASGYASTIAATLPIVIGETGWKSRVTRPSHPIENFAANPVNQKWYLDLLTQWEATGTAPKIIYFVGFDEAWKGTDDGWGLWSDLRVPRYALCGNNSVPSAPVCNADVYSGAGYFH